MNRNELIQELSTTRFCAIPTVMTEDMGLEYDYVTSKGAGSSFGNIGDWPAYKMRGIPNPQWKAIKDKIEAKTVEESDLLGTDLEILIQDLRQIYGELYDRFYKDLSETLESATTLPDALPDRLYCRIDLGNWGDKPDFYIDEKQFLEDFESYYCGAIQEWEDMSDKELLYWYDRTKDDLSSFPYSSFTDEVCEEDCS